MVYINLSVGCIETAEIFYADKLGFFDRTARRLVCNMGVDLILDLNECKTEGHFQCFDQSTHVKSSFWIHIGGDLGQESIELLDHLQRNGVEFEDTSNLGGHYLKFTDPSGNKFTLHAHLGVIQSMHNKHTRQLDVADAPPVL